MNIKEKIEEIVERLKSDKELMAKFQENPIEALEGLIGVDLPDDKIDEIVAGVKAKISLDSIGDKLGGLFGKK